MERNCDLLVVDDDPVVRQLLRDVFRDSHYRVLEAGSADAARAILDRQAPDLVLLDIGLPGKDHLGKTDADLFTAQLSRRLRANDAEVLKLGAGRVFEEQFEIDRQQLIFATRKFPLFDADGSPVGICLMASDVTTERRTELLRKAWNVTCAAAAAAWSAGAPKSPWFAATAPSFTSSWPWRRVAKGTSSSATCATSAKGWNRTGAGRNSRPSSGRPRKWKP